MVCLDKAIYENKGLFLALSKALSRFSALVLGTYSSPT